MRKQVLTIYHPKHIGFVFQRFCLVPLTVFDNVAVPEFATGKSCQKRVREILENLVFSTPRIIIPLN